MDHDVELKTCHDIRHWRACDACGGLGDDRKMIRCDVMGCYVTYHEECVISTFKPADILRLPLEELNKFTIGATGVDLMRRIIAVGGMED